jgi:putative ABC transport system substrate-binding protein
MERRLFMTGVAAILAVPVAAEAQQSGRVYRIGVLVLAPLGARPQQWESFRKGLREHGYVEGQNVLVEFRSADGRPERLADLAAELVQANMDVIVGSGTPPVQALQKATRTIPIVMANVGDPVGAGIVTSLARPGGNVTGLSLLATELSAKRVEILKASLPGLARVGILWNPGNASVHLKVKETASAARQLGLQLHSLEVRVPGDLETQIKAAASARADALVTADDQFLSSQRVLLVGLAMQHRLPVVSEFREFVEAGALCSYGPSLNDLARRAATYVDRIIKGARPANLPVEEPTKFEFVINLKTARTLGLTIPHSIVIRADEIID